MTTGLVKTATIMSEIAFRVLKNASRAPESEKAASSLITLTNMAPNSGAALAPSSSIFLIGSAAPLRMVQNSPISGIDAISKIGLNSAPMLLRAVVAFTVASLIQAANSLLPVNALNPSASLSSHCSSTPPAPASTFPPGKVASSMFFSPPNTELNTLPKLAATSPDRFKNA